MVDGEHLLGDEVGCELISLLGNVPKRWGRMNRLSRLLLVESARLLADAGFSAGEKLSDNGITAGLIGISRRGSLATDYDFLATMEAGAGFASPALFGYTLANIPLAEVAVAFGLTGPVYALVGDREKEELLWYVEQEARRHLRAVSGLDYMLACVFDRYQEAGRVVEYVTVDMIKQ